MAALAPAALPNRVWSVSALLLALGDAVASRFSACTVQGELSGFSRAASGHCYFSLKDAEGQAMLIRCAMFRRAASLLDFLPAEGQRVQLRGRVAVYEPRGELQFVVEAMQRSGEGALFEQFLRLKSRLEAEGLFDAARKRPLPRFAQRLGIVTSLAAAALHDVLASLARRAPHVGVVIYPSPVQGPDAPQALADALALAGRRAEVDILLLCRGGGSLDDLWAFNDERVARAVAASPIPVVCGVGHETDVTLADFAADLRAPTPTAAAELATASQLDGLNTLAALQQALRRRTRHALDTQMQALDGLALRLSRPADSVRRQAQQLDFQAHRLRAGTQAAVARQALALGVLAARLRRSAAVQLEGKLHVLAQLDARLGALDPSRVLERGYAWLSDESGQALPSVHGLRVGQALRAVLADGSVDARVTALLPGR